MTKTTITVFISILLLVSCRHDTCKNRCASVRIVDKNSGIGIKNATVHFLWRDSDWSSWFSTSSYLGSSKTDAEGYAHFQSDTALTKGYFEVYAEAPGYAPQTIGTNLAYGQGWTPERVELNPYGYLKVHVQDTTRNDSDVCATVFGRNFCGTHLDTFTFFVWKEPSNSEKRIKFRTYRQGKLIFQQIIVKVFGNDTTMVEIKF